MADDEKIQVEKEPTPEKEAGQFQGKDDTRLAQRNEHALKILEARKGYVDRVVGVINPSMNTAFLLCIPLFILLLVLIGCTAAAEKPEKFSTILDLVAKLFTLAFGVGIGAASVRNKD